MRAGPPTPSAVVDTSWLVRLHLPAVWGHFAGNPVQNLAPLYRPVGLTLAGREHRDSPRVADEGEWSMKFAAKEVRFFCR